jgi:hypothetical protein
MLNLSVTSYWCRNFIRLSCILAFCVGALAQATPRPEACAELGDAGDFVVVDENRARLQRELPEEKAKAKDLEDNKIPQAKKAEKDLKDINDKIEHGETSPELEKAKTSLQAVLGGKTVEDLQNDLQKVKDLISWKEVQLKCVNGDIRKLAITPEQSFKRDMSFYFAIIIGLLILGFFTMGFFYKTVGEGNFSGQTGLQFVTLFSIVIAIILFGITGILEAKELAALLGGLSGYILGRSTAPSGNDSARGASPTGEKTGPNPAGSITAVSVTPTTATLTSAAPTQQLTASATDAQNNPISGLPNYIFQWISDDSAIATVDQSGLVTRVATGICNVKAIANGLSSNNCIVTCEQA